jgi:hypothetical protein
MPESLTEVRTLKQLLDKGLGRRGSNMRRSLLFIFRLNRRELRLDASVAQRGRTAVACPRACALPRDAPPRDGYGHYP